MSEEKKVKNVNKNENPGFFAKVGRWFVKVGKWFATKFKGMASELKKVSWPNFAKVVKQTTVVLGVILVFLVLITAIDYGFQALLTLVTK